MRRLLIAVMIAGGWASARPLPALDAYGGRTDIACSNGAQTHFYTQKIDHRWWFCTPAGHAFFQLNVAAMTVAGGDASDIGPQGTSYTAAATAKYGSANSYSAWATAQISRLSNWGFNDVGEYSDGRTWASNYPWSVLLNVSRVAARNDNNYVASAAKNVMNGVNPAHYNGFYAPSIDTYENSHNGSSSGWDRYASAYISHDQAGFNAFTNSGYIVDIVADDRDVFYGWGPGSEYGYTNPCLHLGWAILATAPKQWWYSGVGGAPIVYSDSKLYAKYGLQAYLESLPQYQTSGVPDIAKLNTAWGASYTSWGSTGSNAVDTICSGQWNGVKTTCAGTLAHSNVVAKSLGVLVNGTVWGGDHFLTLNGTGATPVSGSVTAVTGAFAITFGTPPPNGATVTINYDYNGWGYGTGLLDEDARNAWVCGDYVGLSGCSASMQTDLNNFLYQYGKQYSTYMAAILRAAYPGILIGGVDSLNNPDGGKSRNQLLQANAEDFDFEAVNIGCGTLAVDAACTAYASTMLSDTYAAMGQNKPIRIQRELWANQDSPYSATPSGTCYGCAPTQAAKGTAYYNWMNWIISSGADSVTGDYPIAASMWWEFMDKAGEEKNFGLVSNIDNAYDGSEDVAASVTCSDPLGAYTCGGESANYGNSITAIKDANTLWLQLTPHRGSSLAHGHVQNATTQ